MDRGQVVLMAAASLGVHLPEIDVRNRFEGQSEDAKLEAISKAEEKRRRREEKRAKRAN